MEELSEFSSNCFGLKQLGNPFPGVKGK